MISMEAGRMELVENNSVSDEQILSYIWAVVRKFREREEGNSIECILCEEKLIHLTVVVLERGEAKVEFGVGEEVGRFVQKVNRLAMENIKDEEDGGNIKFISKAVDVVMLPQVARYVTDHSTLTKLKVLTFNNLSCILKKNRHFMMALKAISYAIDLEENLISDFKDEEKYDIVPTYLNKAAILSEMKKHEKALEEIRKARTFVEKIERDVEVKLKECKDEEMIKRLEEKRHYGLYMKMLIHYNIGVEKEHQRLISSAISYYQEGRRLAIIINNQFMTKKLEDIIAKLRAQ
jgi:tetratricopeptide (TPR) repeat protein